MRDCFNDFTSALSGKFTKGEQEDLIKIIDAAAIYAKRKGLDPDAVRLDAAKKLAKKIRQDGLYQKRVAVENLTKKINNISFVESITPNEPWRGIEAIQVGINLAKKGARSSVDLLQKTLFREYSSRFEAELNKLGHWDILKSGVMDDEISHAMYALGKKDAARLKALPKEAVEIAKVMRDTNELMRQRANKAGANIGQIDEYIQRQAHSMDKIRKMGVDAWKELARKTFDWDEMLLLHGSRLADKKGIDKFLNALWRDFTTGDHIKRIDDMPSAGVSRGSNITKRLNGERSILFRDSAAWVEYNKAAGQKNIRESIASSMRSMADKTALMEKMGTNPDNMLAQLIDEFKGKLKDDFKAYQKLQESETRLRNNQKNIDGSVNIPANEVAAKIGSNLRSFEVITKLGGMVFSQFGDLAVYAHGMKYQGRGFFTGMGEALSAFTASSDKSLTNSLGLSIDHMVGDMARVGGFEQPSMLTNATKTFMRWNLGSWWQNKLRSSAVIGMANHLASVSELAFDQLPEKLKRTFSLYNIDQPQWEALRGAAREIEGQRYILPEEVTNIDAQRNYRNYLTDQTDYLVLEPDARTRAMINQGQQAGTFSGELLRTLGLFKSFNIAYIQKILGRELFGQGYEGSSIFGALSAGNGELMGLAQLFIATTAMGYLSMQTKALVAGKEPRKVDNVDEFKKVFFASALQGGGAGIFGDLIFGETNRVGGGFTDTLAGPIFTKGSDIVGLYHAIISGDDAKAKALKLAASNTPFANLFYIAPIFKYAVLYQAQEAMNPGYLRRMENRIQKETGQKFLYPPSQYVR